MCCITAQNFSKLLFLVNFSKLLKILVNCWGFFSKTAQNFSKLLFTKTCSGGTVL